MDEIYIPTLLFWENGNTWYGSRRGLRFFIQPVKHEDRDGAATLDAEIWRGPLAKEFSQVYGRNSFPLSDEGIEQLRTWLAEEEQKLDS